MKLKTLTRSAVILMAVLSAVACADIWKFGVMGDTQWSGTDPTGQNVNTVAVNHIRAVKSAVYQRRRGICDSSGRLNR